PEIDAIDPTRTSARAVGVHVGKNWKGPAGTRFSEQFKFPQRHGWTARAKPAMKRTNRSGYQARPECHARPGAGESLMLGTRRREFIALRGSGGVVWPLGAVAQQPIKIARIGYLGPRPDNPMIVASYSVIASELRRLGFIEGQNLTIA